MGQDIAFPVLISPTGVQAVDPEGEVAVARAAAAADIAMGLSSFASKPIDQVVAANPKLFFQSYWVGDRDGMLVRAERARAAGAKGFIVTLNWVFDSRRDRGSPFIPEKLDLKATARYARRSRSGRSTCCAGCATARCPTSASRTSCPRRRGDPHLLRRLRAVDVLPARRPS